MASASGAVSSTVNPSTTGGTNVSVTVEAPTENQVVEITYDGQEVLQPPLSLAEHLAKQAGKVDFAAVVDGDGLDDDDDDDDEDEDDDEDDDEDMETGDDDGDEEGAVSADRQPAPNKTAPKKGGTASSSSSAQPQQWEWESVRNKLRDALTEMSVLSDVITVATKDCGKDPATGNPRRYMVLDGPVQYEPPEPRPHVSLHAKKKSLDIPAKILQAGAEHLRALQSENKKNQSSSDDFHSELLRLRQNWRLKKVSNTILGDLSYKTAGSLYKQSGVFEVVKAEAEDSISGGGPALSAAGDGEGTAAGEGQKSSLKVNVPSELEGIAYIQVLIQKESAQLVTANLSHMGAFPGSEAPDQHWQRKLEAAQNVLFCKELFSQLAKEAISLQAPIPHMVVGNQITASLFLDIQLIISYCHQTGGGDKKSSGGSEGGQGGQTTAAAAPSPHLQGNHSHDLEHSLHQLLRRQHSKNINHEGPCLSSAPVGISKRRRLAGPRAADRRSLLEMATQKTLLEQIIHQAQHVVLRLRTMFVLDTMAKDLKDPLITCHLGTMNSPTRTSVKVSIVTAGYDSVLRTQLVIHVGEKQLTVVCKDGKVLHFSHEPQELRDFILCQISQHQINGVQALAKCTGWTVLSSSSNLGCGPVEPLSNATGCLLSSPKGDRYIAVRNSATVPQMSAVWTSSVPSTAAAKEAQSAVRNKKWDNMPDGFHEVRLDKMDGKNLLNKLELIMSALANSGHHASQLPAGAFT